MLTTGEERVDQSLGICRREKNLLRGKQSDDGGRDREEDNKQDQMEGAETGKGRKQARRENPQKGEKIACWTRRRIRLFDNPWVREENGGQQEEHDSGHFYMIMDMRERPTGSQ